VYSAAAHQTMNDLGSLMASPWRRAVGGEVSCGSDQDGRCLSVAVPREVLAHGSLQILQHVEAGILAQKRMAEERYQVGGRITNGDVTRRQPSCLRDLLLAVAGIKKRAAKLRPREGCSAITTWQARWWHIEIAIEIDGECAMNGGAQGQRLCFNVSAAVGRPRNETKGGVGVAKGVVRAFPIRMIITRAEMSDTQGGGESDRPRYVARRCTVAQRI
jgi:hypothetical protein